MTSETEIEFDPVKDARNLAKHGVSLADATEFEWETARTQEDVRFIYAEKRFEAKGWLRGSVHVLVFCLRGGETRVISLRRANEREIRTYANSN